MLDDRPAKELPSVLDTVRAKVKPDIPTLPMRKAITEALAEINDLRFTYGDDCLSEEEMERIRKHFEAKNDCVAQDN